MQNLVFTQLSIPEIRQIFREEIREELQNFSPTKTNQQQNDGDEIGKGAAFAAHIIGKAIPTIYTLVHKRQLPHMKRGKDLYFSRKALLDWLREGKRKTTSEITSEAESFQPNSTTKKSRKEK